MSRMSVSHARANLPQLVDRVLAGEEVTLTRHGQAVAVVVRPDSLRTRRAAEALASASKIRDLLAAGRRTPLHETGGVSASRADELAEEVRASRDRP